MGNLLMNVMCLKFICNTKEFKRVQGNPKVILGSALGCQI